MQLPKLKRYRKKFEFSYAFGAYPVLDLLKYKSDKVIGVLIKDFGADSDGLKEVIDICKSKNIPVEENSKAIDRISVKENTYVVAVFAKYTCELSSGKNHLVLVEPSDFGNIGTVVRTMVGFDFYDLAIIKPAVDVFNPTVVRATMGAIFHINFAYFSSIEDYLQKFPENNCYPFMLDGAKKITDVNFVEPVSFIQGNEGSGLGEKYKEIGQSVFIPHSKNIDSLNLAVATSIGLWEFRRKSL